LRRKGRKSQKTTRGGGEKKGPHRPQRAELRQREKGKTFRAREKSGASTLNSRQKGKNQEEGTEFNAAAKETGQGAGNPIR